MRYRWLSIVLILPLQPLHARADDAAADDIPVVGRPADLPFSGASGSFQIQALARPTAVRADESITLTVTVRAIGPLQHPPSRTDLRQLPAFNERFYVENPDERQRQPDAQTWQFIYRLKPRQEASEIPAVPFVYFNPAIVPASKGFQVLFTDAIPLNVLPAEPYAPLPTLPAEVFRIADERSVLAHERLPQSLGRAALFLLVAGPPLACVGWYLVWRTLYPDAARQTRRRRSEAARRSLKVLRAARRLPPPQRADSAADAMAKYLQDRFELNAAEPGPAEAAKALERARCPVHLQDETARFISACDAARFAPAADGATLADEATRLILAVEAETWASHHS
jgi:hypothetical protein